MTPKHEVAEKKFNDLLALVDAYNNSENFLSEEDAIQVLIEILTTSTELYAEASSELVAMGFDLDNLPDPSEIN